MFVIIVVKTLRLFCQKAVKLLIVTNGSFSEYFLSKYLPPCKIFEVETHLVVQVLAIPEVTKATVSEDEYDTPSNKHHVNEVTLIGQILSLKCCYPHEILAKF